jgi:hypothetical protein
LYSSCRSVTNLNQKSPQKRDFSGCKLAAVEFLMLTPQSINQNSENIRGKGSKRGGES